MTKPSFQSLVSLYKQMDNAWDSIAAAYDFTCCGCEDNCCTSLFFHHTHIERAYLIHGFHQLAPDVQDTILNRAETYCARTFSPDPTDNGSGIKSLKIFCPANEDGRCLLYPYRPMICRLHGLPHELCRPGASPIKGSGCHAGDFDHKAYIKFDRTPFYRQMAGIEMAFRRDMNKTGRLKETVAQILISQ